MLDHGSTWNKPALSGDVTVCLVGAKVFRLSVKASPGLALELRCCSMPERGDSLPGSTPGISLFHSSKSSFYCKSFVYRGDSAWNTLPVHSPAIEHNQTTREGDYCILRSCRNSSCCMYISCLIVHCVKSNAILLLTTVPEVSAL